MLIRDVIEIDKRVVKELLGYMKDLYSNVVENNDFDDLFKEKIYNLFCEYSDVFFKDDLDLGYIIVIEYEIDIGDSKFIKLLLRRVFFVYVEVEL